MEHLCPPSPDTKPLEKVLVKLKEIALFHGALASLGFLEVTAASVARISLSEIQKHHVSEIQSTFLEQSGLQTFEAG